MRNHKPVFAFVLAIAMTASASSANATETWSPPAEEEPAAPSRMKSAGIGLTAAGGVFLGAGGIVAAAGTTQERLGQIPFLMGGGLLGGTGILLSAVGIPLWVAGAREESERDLAIVAGPRPSRWPARSDLASTPRVVPGSWSATRSRAPSTSPRTRAGSKVPSTRSSRSSLRGRRRSGARRADARDRAPPGSAR